MADASLTVQEGGGKNGEREISTHPSDTHTQLLHTHLSRPSSGIKKKGGPLHSGEHPKLISCVFTPQPTSAVTSRQAGSTGKSPFSFSFLPPTPFEVECLISLGNVAILQGRRRRARPHPRWRTRKAIQTVHTHTQREDNQLLKSSVPSKFPALAMGLQFKIDKDLWERRDGGRKKKIEAGSGQT